MSGQIKVTFLGTGDAMPTAKRNHSAILLTYQGENILIDCGEGTQRQFRLAKLNPCKVTKILITHWHGDHILGLPGMLQTMAFSGYGKELEIYGPKGTKKYVDELFRMFVFVDKFSVKVHEVEKDGIFFDAEDFCLVAKKTFHGVPSLAYNFVKKGLTRIDKNKIKKFKLPHGVHMKKLLEGKDIVLEGRKFKAKELTYKDNDRKISIVLDTAYDKSLAPFVKNSELLIMESSFADEEKKLAGDHKHMTSTQAASVAKDANAKALYLTHISQRYENTGFQEVLKEAKKKFKNTHLAEDLMSIEI